jgi:glycogen synthase
MHILVTADTLGGVWTYARELVTGLVRRGARVTLLSFGDIPQESQTGWMQGLRDLDYRPTGFKLEWMQNSEGDMEASLDYLRAVVEETRPDLLHLNQFYYGVLETEIPKLVVAHSDVVSWWWAVHKQKPVESAWLRWYRDIVSSGLNGATAIAAPSAWMLEQVQTHYGPFPRTAVIHNGRTPGLFKPHQLKAETVVTVGRLWDGGKNAGLLLRDEMPLPVHIIGADRHPELNTGAFQMEEIRANVHLEPQQNEKELSSVFARAAIYAATSQYEPFGLAPLEAALSRCAVVASDIPSFREVWDGAAVFFRSNDVQDLRGALERLAGDPGLRRRHANLCYDRARRNFTAAQMVDRYLELYHTLVPASVTVK